MIVRAQRFKGLLKGEKHTTASFVITIVMNIISSALFGYLLFEAIL